MDLVQGNKIMVKTNGLAIILLLMTPIMLTACSDKEQATTDTKNTVQQEQTPIANSDLDDLINTKDDVPLQDLMQQVAEAKRYAEEQGFVWSTTDPLIEKGYVAVKAGNEEQAKAFFQEAKMQYKLSIIQARYAEQHWEMLIPKVN